jgi:hypothetical protein
MAWQSSAPRRRDADHAPFGRAGRRLRGPDAPAPGVHLAIAAALEQYDRDEEHQTAAARVSMRGDVAHEEREQGHGRAESPVHF